MTERRHLAIDQVWRGDDRHRRILGVMGGVVVYSNGGDKNGMCQARTFLAWIRRAKATRVDCKHTGRERNAQ